MRNNKGFTLIELLVVILIIGILLALMIPNFVLFQERARRTSVKNNMHVVQTALEAYAVDHYGVYPSDAVSWAPDDPTGICVYFPGGDVFVNMDGEVIPGKFPVNPYNNRRYNDEELGNTDLDYETHYGALEFRGQNAITRGAEDDCYYLDQAMDFAGGIAIATWLNENNNALPTEYGIFGYGRDPVQPIYDLDPTADDPADPTYWNFFVLHN
ncbi:MAG: prepilin-type N-terminal cleavage/methylation domain-containing protein [candidate division WOR-3 bacterium]